MLSDILSELSDILRTLVSGGRFEPSSLVRYGHFEVTAGCDSVDSFYHPLNVRAKLRPLLLAENYDRDLTARKVLLMTHVLVRCQQ